MGARRSSLRPRTHRGRRVSREYPDYPRVGVGAVVLSRERVLLVRRGKPPAEGRWSLPGGLVELGETSVGATRNRLLLPVLPTLAPHEVRPKHLPQLARKRRIPTSSWGVAGHSGYTRERRHGRAFMSRLSATLWRTRSNTGRTSAGSYPETRESDF